MNKGQYHNLLIYIKRQEKVMDTYLKKYEQVKVQIFKSDERYDLHKDEIITVQ